MSDEERRAVVGALNRLVESDRLVIALRHFEHMSEREMAEVLDCAAGTVKSRLSRAMARLRDRLRADNDVDDDEVGGEPEPEAHHD